MPEYNGPYIYATTHDFKSNIAKYMRLLEQGEYEAVFIKRYDKPVAFVCPLERSYKKSQHKAQQNQSNPQNNNSNLHESE